MSKLEALAVVCVVKQFRVYLYSHKCEVYTDHEALLSLISHPHPSGKLVRWGLALQEFDLIINYRPIKLNQLADSLSKCLRERFGQAAEKDLVTKDKEKSPENHLASAVDMEEIPENHFVSAVNKETALSKHQALDPELAMVIKYLQSGDLPPDEKKAREIILGKSRYIC